MLYLLLSFWVPLSEGVLHSEVISSHLLVQIAVLLEVIHTVIQTLAHDQT